MVWRFLKGTRPFLIIALIVGASRFAPAKPNRQPTTNDQRAVAETSGEQTAGGGASSSANEALPPSLLAEIFGTGAIDPFFKLPGQTTNDLQSTTASESATTSGTASEPETEPARSIYRYLKASSDIGFRADESRLSLALATADAGDTKGLDQLIAEREAQLEAFRALAAPPELAAIHEASVAVLARYIDFFKKVRAAAPGGVQEAWESEERRAIGKDAADLVQKLYDIVHTYNIVPPEGVLP